jgi:hypothetical protein
VIVPVVNARVLVRPGLVFHLAAAGRLSKMTPQQKSFRPWRAYTPPAWRRCVAACAAYRILHVIIFFLRISIQRNTHFQFFVDVLL